MIKYTVPYRSYDNASWEVTIDIPSHEGDPILVRGVADRACMLVYDGGIDDVWDNPVVNVKAQIETYNQGQIDVQELQVIDDRTGVVTVKRNNEIRFKGYLMSDNMQRQFSSPPYNVRIAATSGLDLLQAITFSGFGGELGPRSPLNFFRRILMHSVCLGIDLPLRWSTSVEAIQTEISGDPVQNLRWGNDGRAYYTYDPSKGTYTYQNCRYIVEGLVKSLQARIVQADGAWWIIGIKEHLKDVVDYYECANATGPAVVTQHTRQLTKHIGREGRYQFVREDQVLTVKPALSQVTVTYEHDQRKNIIPNGGFDEPLLGSIMHWTTDGSSLFASLHADITGQGGYAAELRNLTSGVESRFYLQYPIPVDANVLYRNINWGFSFMLLNGYELDGGGFIDWRNNPIKTSVKYTVNRSGTVTEYYLNEFGYWGDKNSPANAQVSNITWESTQGGTLYVSFEAGKNFYVGDEVVIRFWRNGNPENYRIQFNETMDVESGLDYITSIIPNSANPIGPPDTFYVLQVENNAENNAYTQKQEDYYKYIYFTVDRLKLNDSAAVTYTGAGALEVKTVDPGVLDQSTPAGVGLLSIEFFVLPGKHLVLDDVWMTVNDNKDVYSAKLIESKNANKQAITLGVSSAFSGFKVSNYTRSYHQSNVDYLFTDGERVGSLTELYARAVMQWRYKASTIFNGTISTRGEDWSYLDNYTIATLGDSRFVPVNPTYNTETNEVYLMAMEGRNDTVALEVKHYGSDYNLEA